MADQWNLGSSYVIEREIGSGGMGNVWLGHDHEGTPYAVKVLREELARDADVLRRFVRERSVLLGLDHPSLVRVHDLVVEKNILAIVMDYVDGPDLRHFLSEQGTVAPRQAALLAQKIAAALDAVHSVGIVHRDLKPENILVENPMGEPYPRLADFGIATIAVEGVQLSTAIIGTPHYMAPELFDGESPTPAVDVYSLGIILFELLCGIQPYRGTPVQLIAQHATSRPGRPAGIPDSLWQAIDDMTSIDASKRPSSAAIAQRMGALVGSLAGFPALTKLSVPPTPVRIGGVQQATSVSIWSNPTVPVSQHDIPARSQPPPSVAASQQTPSQPQPNGPASAQSQPHSRLNGAPPASMPAPFVGNQSGPSSQQFPANQQSSAPPQPGGAQRRGSPQRYDMAQRVSTPQQFSSQTHQARTPTPWKAIVAGVSAVVLIGIGVWGVQSALANKSEGGGGAVSTDPSISVGSGPTTPSPSPSTSPGPSTYPPINQATPVSFDEPIRSELNDNKMWYGELTIAEPTTTLFFVSTYGDADVWLSVYRNETRTDEGDDGYWSNEDRDEIFATFTTNPTDPALAVHLDPGEYNVEVSGAGSTYTDSSFMLETFAAADTTIGETLLTGVGLEPDEGWRAHFLSVEVPSAGSWEFDAVTTNGDVKMGVIGLETKHSTLSDASTAGAGSEKDPNIVTSLEAERTLVIVQEETFQPFDATLTVKAL